MHYVSHPVFGQIATDPDDTDKLLAQIDREADARQEREIAFFTQALDFYLHGIGDEPVAPPHIQRLRARPICPPAKEPPFEPKTRFEDGKVWYLQPRGTSPRADDLIDDAGLWRPMEADSAPSPEAPAKPDAPRPAMSRYDRAFVSVRSAEQNFKNMLAAHDPAHPETILASDAAVKAREAFEKERALSASDIYRLWSSRDQYRQTEEGRETYNAKRRKVRAMANRKLSAMTADDRAEYIREREREKKRRQRAAKKAEQVPQA